MDSASRRISLFAVMLLFFSSGAEARAQDAETPRSWWQSAMGYYTAADGWKDYSGYRSKMEQPLDYTEYQFTRLPISEIDKLAREAKNAYDLYCRYEKAASSVALSKVSKKPFWALGDRQLALVEAAEDTASKWPTYRDNMSRMTLPFKSAQEFFDLPVNERAQLLADSHGTTRGWSQAFRGYYNAADGWNTYRDCRLAMEQPLNYTEYQFMHLSIPELDNLTREAKNAYDLYCRYEKAASSVALSKVSKKPFWALGDRQLALVEAAEDTASKWPTYRDNMSRMTLPFKSAQEFFDLPVNERAALLAHSQGTQRGWGQALRGYYNATDGWTTYRDCRLAMEQPLDYSEHQFMQLSIPEIDKLAREAKNAYDSYCRYEKAADSVGLRKLSKKDFWALGDKQLALMEAAEDTAAKWPEYRDNMQALGEPFIECSDFFTLESDERGRLYIASRGTSRSFWQFMSRSYSASDGWKTYRDSLNEMKVPVKYKEYEFVNLDVRTIDQLARHAAHSRNLHARLKELCRLAGKPCPYQASEVYGSDDLSKWEQEYDAREQEWAARVLYADSCRRVGSHPNWRVFESKSASEQLEAAAYAESLAQNFTEYEALCDKLEYPINKKFLELPVEVQRDTVSQLSDDLWSQRKEVIKKAAVVVGVIVAAIIVKKAVDEFRDVTAPSSSGVSSGQGSSSRIDREAFAKDREAFWKSEAQSNVGAYIGNPDNLQRMKLGKAPIGADGFPVELHHPGGDPNAALLPMTRSDHRLGDNYRKNHSWLFEDKP